MHKPISQVGGTHYKSAVQHWDLVAMLSVGYFEGCITKYVTRYKKKNGLQDLEKAQHFLAKLIEVASLGYAPRVRAWNDRTEEIFLTFVKENSLSPIQERICRLLFVSWTTDMLTEVDALLVELVSDFSSTPVSPSGA
jgi:hypothetical protein